MHGVEHTTLIRSKVRTDPATDDLIDQSRVFQVLQSLVVAQIVFLATNGEKYLWEGHAYRRVITHYFY